MDDLLVISLDSLSIILEVTDKFKLKKDKMNPPELYIRVRLTKKSLNVHAICNI